MKLSITKLLSLLLAATMITSCSKDDDEIDTEKPFITINYDYGFPKACAQLKRGQTYVIRAKVTDNVGIASYGIDIHNNCDQHTHDDQAGSCPLDPKKAPVNPMIYMQNFSVDNGGVNYEIAREITIPQNIDTGDYHCQISAVDQTGWQARTSIDIKIVE
jgi:hypothetical protein